MLILSILTVLLTIIAGYLLRQFKVVEADFGKKLLLIGFYFTVPAIFLRVLSEIKLSASDGVFLAVLLLGVIASFIIGIIATKLMNIPKIRAGSIVLASMIMNTGFVFSFAQASFGDYGVAKIAIANLVVATSTFTLGFIVASFYGTRTSGMRNILLKPLTAPALLVIPVALFISLNDIDISAIYPMLDFIGQPTGFMTALAVGTLIEIKAVKIDVALPILARWIVGSILIVWLLSYDGMSYIDKAIAAAVLMSPLGFNSVTLSALEGLDTDYNANALSVSLLIGLVTVPIIILLFA